MNDDGRYPTGSFFLILLQKSVPVPFLVNPGTVSGKQRDVVEYNSF